MNERSLFGAPIRRRTPFTLEESGVVLGIVLIAGLVVWSRGFPDRDRVDQVDLTGWECTCDQIWVAKSPGEIVVAERVNTIGYRVDLNTADVAELELLPRIGPGLAQRIVEYRGETGGFRSPDDLMEVSGVGDVTYAGVADLVRVSEVDL
ncbi:MAG: helix-hairpin-helix domain-containing protein [Planctomycetia bacterium]|nr:helix-hairpin-helix domain-containing protein [Planctomycetia bacterium]